VSHEYELRSSKNSGPLDDSQKQNGDFLEDSFSDFDEISVIYGSHLSKQNCVDDIFREITVHARVAQPEM
jgi:hypothetical protein